MKRSSNNLSVNKERTLFVKLQPLYSPHETYELHCQMQGSERLRIIPGTSGMNTCDCWLNSSRRTHQKFMLHIARLSSEFDRTLRVTVHGWRRLELPSCVTWSRFAF
ncbi:uncharacterized protein LOC122529432 [Frieseomelitta varia]|uniref:uncharacterized protein LOC122529432 n=1 Tax=Frieseomelitta varia TaxID=561572 RepID=UPI001CB6A903|nr:uncharacterized protein LOC122529432 [Frieseomelitta varia]